MVTVAVTGVDLGSFNLWIAMAIATVKATLVLLYFMHLRYDRPINAIVFVTALLFVALFVSIALLDTRAYEPGPDPGLRTGASRNDRNAALATAAATRPSRSTPAGSG